ncbi:replication protein RepA [Alteromonas sp. 5E99-2]|uniref:replication protein RepA n=1 Tax=Alteromonas sp. 5E99-2 TaxID=2817683 RepID=UPI001A97F19A|nr:replication protein RepA [Alteromonas sp. 5E99-2]
MDRPRLVTADQFIDDAVSYANGVRSGLSQKERLMVVPHMVNVETKMRRATFTLSSETIDNLSEVAKRTGISKSRIIRILSKQHLGNEKDPILLESKTK